MIPCEIARLSERLFSELAARAALSEAAVRLRPKMHRSCEDKYYLGGQRMYQTGGLRMVRV